MSSSPILNRRRLLQVLGMGGAALAMRDFLPLFSQKANATDGEPLYFLCCTFDGGWDQLLALDPRDNTLWSDPEGSIYPAYDVLAGADSTLDALLTSNPSGLVRPGGSNIAFGPAVGRLAEGDLYQELCVVRGVNMGTLTHEVGKRYSLTGKFPRGLQASGSSLATVLVNGTGDGSTIPNLVVGMETYNEGLSSFASGLVIQSSQDLQQVLTPLGSPLSASVNAALDAYLQPSTQPCGYDRLDGNGQVTQYLSSRRKALQMVEADLGALFAFSATTTDPALQALNAAFHLSSTTNVANQQLAGAVGDAMIAAQAITHDVCQAVSIRLASGIDHHDDSYLTDHSAALRMGFDALADLITWLRNTVHPITGKSYWSHTVLLCTSDFARTPRLNNRNGRDHHLASSFLVGGKGIKGNQVIGATDDDFNTTGIDLTTGASVGPNGWTVRPPDIHATLLEAIGLPWDHLENQSPQLIQAMLK